MPSTPAQRKRQRIYAKLRRAAQFRAQAERAAKFAQQPEHIAAVDLSYAKLREMTLLLRVAEAEQQAELGSTPAIVAKVRVVWAEPPFGKDTGL